MTADAERAGTADDQGEAEERAVTVVEAHPSTQIAIFGSDEPTAIAERVMAVAGPLAAFIKQKDMTTNIQGREYVLAEGWSFAGALLGVAPRTVRVVAIEDGFEAEVELLVNGQVISGAIAECTRQERSWSNRDSYALKSMAQTRAMGKAFRMAFGFVMKAAGFEVTPAEEMPVPDRPRNAPQAETNAPQAERRQSTQEVRPGTGERVPIVREMINGGGMLLKWAAQEFGASQEEVLKHFGIEVLGGLPPLVRERFEGDYRLAADDLKRDVMEPKGAGDAATEPVDQAEAPDAPVHTAAVDQRPDEPPPNAAVLGTFASLPEFLSRCEDELNKSPADIKRLIGLSARVGDRRILEYVAQNGITLDAIVDALILGDSSDLPHVSVDDAEQAAGDAQADHIQAARASRIRGRGVRCGDWIRRPLAPPGRLALVRLRPSGRPGARRDSRRLVLTEAASWRRPGSGVR